MGLLFVPTLSPAFLAKRLYTILRHPMYMAMILLFLMMPLVLGFWYALVAFVL